MEFDVILKALEDTSIATAVRENDVLFPWIESVHVLAITLVFGCIAIVDLRLMALASLDRALSRVTKEVLPCVWVAFALAAITGGLLFSSNARVYLYNPYFVTKFIFMGLAGVNMLVFHFGVGREMAQWGAPSQMPPLKARVVGATSLLFWFGVITFGRIVGFHLVQAPPA
jgi:hypothetical protein